MEFADKSKATLRDALCDKLDFMQSGKVRLVLTDGSTITVHAPAYLGTDYLECDPGPDGDAASQIIPLRSIVTILL
jgi:hypothetical protein